MYKADDTKRYFTQSGKPRFFLSDTAWMAFTNLEVDEFREYAGFRKSQGFDSLLIQNTPAFQDMPAKVKYFPFKVNPDGRYDLSFINPEYFEQVKRKMDILKALEMTAFIVPMWVSFIPGSQMEKVYDCSGKQFTDFKHYTDFIDYSVNFYKEYHPVWLIGGDAEMTGEGTTNYQYYSYLAEKIRRECPGDILSAHVAGGQKVDKIYADMGYIDFYTYQSGHMYNNFESLMSPNKMALDYYHNEKAMPIMNAEPMYEAHGFGNKFGRFTDYYVRRAFWYSVLGGAVSGFTYGAHGIWMFYDGSGFNNESWSLVPMKWRSAMKLKGSYDASRCKEIFEEYGMFDLVPDNSLNLTPYKEITAAASPDKSKIVLYTPYMNYMYVQGDLSGYDCTWYIFDRDEIKLNAEKTVVPGTKILADDEENAGLQKARVQYPEGLGSEKEVTLFEMPQFNCDGLLVCVKKRYLHKEG